MRKLLLAIALVAPIVCQVPFGGPGMSKGTAPTPTDSPGAGTYTSTQSVTLTNCANFKCYYTNDGTTTPNCTGTGTLYTGAISTAATTTYKAIMCQLGLYVPSSVLTSTYTINNAPTYVTYNELPQNSSGIKTFTFGSLTYAKGDLVYLSWRGGSSPSTAMAQTVSTGNSWTCGTVQSVASASYYQMCWGFIGTAGTYALTLDWTAAGNISYTAGIQNQIHAAALSGSADGSEVGASEHVTSGPPYNTLFPGGAGTFSTSNTGYGVLLACATGGSGTIVWSLGQVGSNAATNLSYANSSNSADMGCEVYIYNGALTNVQAYISSNTNQYYAGSLQAFK